MSIEIIIKTQREQTCTCQGIACTRSFDMGLTSAEGQKLGSFKWSANNTFGRVIR